MAGSIKMKGKTVDEAVEMALQVLGKNKEEVDIKVITEGESGVLGMFGGKEAEVEVVPKMGVGDEAKNLVQDVLDKTGFITLVSVTSEDSDNVSLDIKGEDMGRIIGKEGATLDALQYLASVILGKRHAKRIRVLIDAEKYRERRQKKVVEEAMGIAKDVEKENKERTLLPMSSADRRVVHLYIQENFPKLTSYSRGEGPGRQVVIAPKELAPKEE